MKTINITLLRGFFRITKNGDLERKNKASGIWRIVNSTKNTNKGYCQVAFDGSMCFYHRLVWCLHYGEDIKQGDIIDHKDGNKVNNKIENLRIADIYQNGWNAKKRKNKKCDYKGVSRITGRKTYRAYIQVRKKLYYLGVYKTQKAAYAAYCEASKKYHGEFGRTE